MKIAVVHPYAVHEGAVGGTTRVNGLVRHLARRHTVTVYAHATGDPDEDEAAIEDLATIGVEQRLFPRPRPGLVERLRWLAGPDPYFVGRNRNGALERAVLGACRSGGVDVIHTEFAYLRPLLPAQPRRTVLVLAEQELMSLMIRRLGTLPLDEISLYERYLRLQLRRVERFERRVLPTYDVALAITPGEAQAMEEASGRRVGVLPHVVSTSTFCPGVDEEQGDTVLFVGNYVHRPNLHAARWMVEEVWPRVRAAVPGARFRMVGPGLSDDVRQQWHGRDGVEAVGRVEDLVGAYRKASVFVNSVHLGAGMRGKVLEAFAVGRPVVSTTIGLEGIEAEAGVACQRADEPGAFADAVVGYLRSPSLRAAHGAAARGLVERLYNREVVFTRLEGMYREAMDRNRSTAGARG